MQSCRPKSNLYKEIFKFDLTINMCYFVWVNSLQLLILLNVFCKQWNTEHTEYTEELIQNQHTLS